MANRFERKFLFAIYIDGKQTSLDNFLGVFHGKFSQNTAKDNAASAEFSQEPRLEQLGHYYDGQNHRLVLIGVANGQDLVEVAEEGQPKLVMVEADKPKVQAFLNSVKGKIGLQGAMCTWVVVPLDELGGGFGALYTKGMGGVSGSS